MLTKEELKNAKEQAIQRYYLRAPEPTPAMPGLARNVIGVGIGPKLKKDQPPGDLCVRLYVERKITPQHAITKPFLIE